jgi:hypothetical protein
MWKGISAVDCFLALVVESERNEVRCELIHSHQPRACSNTWPDAALWW